MNGARSVTGPLPANVAKRDAFGPWSTLPGLGLPNTANARYNNSRYCHHGLLRECVYCDTPVPYVLVCATDEPEAPSAHLGGEA